MSNGEYHRQGKEGKLIPVVAQAAASNSEITTRRLFVRDPLTKLKFLIDTGADVSVIPYNPNDSLPKQTDTNLCAANGSLIKVFGSKLLELSLDLRRNFRHSFLVATVNRPIIGADFLSKFGLIVDLKNKKLVDSTTNMNVQALEVLDPCPSPKHFAIDSEFASILEEFPELTREPSFKTPFKHNVVHRIDTNGPLPFFKPRRLHPSRLKQAKLEFKQMLEMGICRPSTSPCSSPLHLAAKKDSSDWRPCGDYKGLNYVTIPDRYPMPFISDLSNDLHGKNFFSKIDIVKAYHFIPVAEEDIHKTAVTTPFGLYEFTSMPFGLRNASKTFQRFMNQLFEDLEYVFVYADDILVFSETASNHREHLREVFCRLQTTGLRIKQAKLVLGVPSLDFLSYEVSGTGMRPSASRVSAIREYPTPKTLKDAQRFCGMVNYYRRFVPNMAETLSPITDHIALYDDSKSKFKRKAKKIPKKEFQWPSELDNPLNETKNALAEACLAVHHRQDAEISLSTDASEKAVGAVLQQRNGDLWEPIAFFSKKLDRAQRNYSTYDRELLAIYLALKHFEHFVEGREFCIFTDHVPLTRAINAKTNKSPRQARHLDFISQFTTDIRYVKGELNVVPDALSRIDSLDWTTDGLRKLREEQDKDKDLEEILKSRNPKSSCDLAEVNVPGTNFSVWCEISTGNNRPYIPPALRKSIFEKTHGISHPGIRSTRVQIGKLYFWPSMNRDINDMARKCLPCQKQKIHRHVKSPVDSIPIPPGRFKHVHMDIVGPLEHSDGNQYLLTTVDRFSRWPEAFPMPNMTAETVAKTFVRGYISRYGSIETISTDQGTQFESALMRELNNLLGISRIRTTAYHPQSNGLVERFHRQLKASIRCVCQSRDWATAVPLVLLGIRTTYRPDLKCTPAHMLYGEDLRVPGQLFVPQETDKTLDTSEFVRRIREHFSKISSAPTRTGSQSHAYVPKTLDTCEHVFERVDKVQNSLSDTYIGPFKVIRKTRKSFVILKNGKNQTISIDRLKPAFGVEELQIPINEKNLRKKKTVRFAPGTKAA